MDWANGEQAISAGAWMTKRAALHIAPKSVVALSLCGAGLLAAAKLGAVLQGGSSAMLASTVQSLIDVSFLTLLVHGLSRGAVTAEPLQQGFWTAVVPILVYALGAGVTLYEGIEHVATPRAPARLGYDELLLAAGAAISGTIFWLASDAPSDRRDETSEALRAAVALQAASSAVGHVISLAGVSGAVRWATPEADGIAATLVGLVLIAVASIMAVEAGRLLSGHAEARSAPAPLEAPQDEAEKLETKSLPVHTPEAVPVAVSSSGNQPPPPGQAPASSSGKPHVVARQPGGKGRSKRRR